jgi:hypothetical protein
VNIEFAPNGDDWTTLASNVTATTYEWTVPTVSTEKARMRVTSSTNAQISSTGGDFAIGAPRFEIVIPEPGATICSNQNNQFRWNGDFIDRVRIQYSTDAGTTWRTATQAASYAVSDWQVFSRAGSLGNIADQTACLVRVIDNASNEELDRVENLTINKCDQAVSVQEDLLRPTDMAITGVSPNPVRTEADVTVVADRAMVADIAIVGVDGVVTTLRRDVTVDVGENRITIATEGLASGVYQLIIRSGALTVATPLTVVR